MPVLDMLGRVRNHFDTYPTVRKAYEGDRAGLMNNSLRALGVG